MKAFIDFYRLRDHVNRRVCFQFDPAIDCRPDLRMYLRYKSIPGLLLNQALISELAEHCAYCYCAIAVRSIRKYYKDDVYPQLLAFEPLHKDQIYSLANLGSGRGTCIFM